MKSEYFLLLGAAVAYFFGRFIMRGLLKRRHTGGSFRELYRDNAEALKGGETDD